MVFITTGQRIATENFSDGVIYKVIFVDTTISYMMCVGIGQDFVMLQGPNPSLFCLTMSSASRVSTIDVHDPTPPEPPTPIENALQYQTGEPPFTFTTTESSLFSWYIEGPCGVKTANLFNINGTWTKQNPSDTVTVSGNSVTITSAYFAYMILNVEPNTDYTLSYSSEGNYTLVRGYNSSTFSSANQVFSSNRSPVSFNTGNTETLYILFYSGTGTTGTTTYSNIMLSEGAAIPFEPYGKYKISILSNENAETIYLDEALAEGERLYSVNIDTVVVTDIGENTISVTPTPPEMQIVYGIYAEA